MEHIMVDLETLGTRAGCTILSIGAVAFDPQHGLGQRMYCVVSRASCSDVGLHEDPDTLAWWDQQSDSARLALQYATERGLSLPDALVTLAEFIQHQDPENAKVWGNGSDFDNAILAAAYAAVGMKLPWKYCNNRCYRTLKALHPSVELVRMGVHHNALDDAVTQATHAIELLRATRTYPGTIWQD